MAKVKITIEVERKRPDYATPALARKMRAEGKSVIQIAQDWGISRAQVYNILKQKEGQGAP